MENHYQRNQVLNIKFVNWMKQEVQSQGDIFHKRDVKMIEHTTNGFRKIFG